MQTLATGASSTMAAPSQPWCWAYLGARRAQACPVQFQRCSGHSAITSNQATHRKPGELVHEAAAAAAGVPLIKRFSGGGTVVVDDDTLFATLIFNASALPDVECYPRPVMRWSERFYQPVFQPYGDFSLREHGARHAARLGFAGGLSCAAQRHQGAAWLACRLRFW